LTRFLKIRSDLPVGLFCRRRRCNVVIANEATQSVALQHDKVPRSRDECGSTTRTGRSCRRQFYERIDHCDAQWLEMSEIARQDCQSAMLRCCGDDEVGKSRRVAPPSVPLRAVFSLGGFRTPAAGLAAPFFKRPARYRGFGLIWKKPRTTTPDQFGFASILRCGSTIVSFSE
jgi:hypothetical protein